MKGTLFEGLLYPLLAILFAWRSAYHRKIRSLPLGGRMPRYFPALIVLLLTAIACNWSDIAPPAAPVIEPSPLPTFAISTLTPVPTGTPLPTPTSTPDAPIAWPKDQGVNCRYGPGREWEAVSSLSPGTIVEIEGRVIDTSWWYVQDPLHDGEFCWVAYDVVDTAGNLNIIPIVEPPTASVTKGVVEAVVAFTACGSSSQVTYNGAITTNGPTKVTYHWEISGDAKYTSPSQTIEFIEADTKKVGAEIYSTDCGNYIFRLLTTEPNTVSVEKAVSIQAP